MNPFTYGTLYAALQSWNEDYSTDFQQNLSAIIQSGEQRCLRDLDLDNLDVSMQTGQIALTTGLVAKPVNLIRDRSVFYGLYTGGSGGGGGGGPGGGSAGYVNGGTAALLHFDGANNSTFFPDATGYNVWTPLFGADVETAQFKFGTGALNMPNTIGVGQSVSQLQAPVYSDTALDLFSAYSAGTHNGDFTIECWFYYSSTSDEVSMTLCNYGDPVYASTIGFDITVQALGAGKFWVNALSSNGTWVTAGQSSGAGFTLVKDTWHHVALVRNIEVATIYFDGTAIGTAATNWGVGGAPAKMTIGFSPNRNAGSYLTACFIDELRVSRAAVYTSNFTPNGPFTVPATPGNVSTLGSLMKRSFEFVTEFLIANGANTGPPKYYGEDSPTNWLVAPLPDQAYGLNVRGIYPPPLLGDNDQINAPADIAALQHTTTNVALTQSAAPYVPPVQADNIPGQIQVALTSSGNMSANVFTIVGLDADGDALTSIIAGPNAGTVFTPEMFTSVTTITPSATDTVNYVSAGYLSNNTSWLSTRYPDLLFYSCMIDACHYLKRFSARAVTQNEYAGRLADVQTQVRLLKRSDLDDIFVSRQLINGPGTGPPEMPPAAPAAQQPQPGAQ